MSVRLIVALLMVAAAPFTATVARAEEPFESYPHIRCEACLTITETIGTKMNETSKVKTSIQSSHRLEGGNERRVDYESSELRAVEILDKICDVFFNKYFLRFNATTQKRYFSSDKTLKRAPFYGKPDKAILGAPSRKLQQYCLQLMDESDDVFTRAIMKERTLEGLQQAVCSKGLKVCSNTAAIEKSLAKEEKYRAAHLKYKEKKRMKKLQEQRKKQAEEDAKLAAEEAAAAAEEATETEKKEEVDATATPTPTPEAVPTPAPTATSEDL